MEHNFKPWQPVVVRLHPNGKNRWYADFFSFYDNSLTLPYVCTGGHWAECLPAEGNEHLIGTTDNPTQPEPEFQFGDHVEVRDEDPNRWFSARYLAKDHNKIYPHRVFFEDNQSIARFKYCRYAKQEG